MWSTAIAQMAGTRPAMTARLRLTQRYLGLYSEKFSGVTTSVPVSIVTGVGVPGDVGLNVTSAPPSSTAVHWVVDGQATPTTCETPLAITAVWRLGPGETGSNVISWLDGKGAPMALVVTAVHWLVDGHAIAYPPLWAGTGVPGEFGSNVTSSSLPPTAVH